MKELFIRKKANGKYEYGYKLQKLDIEFMIEIGLQVPDKIKEIYGQGFNEDELYEYVYFDDPLTIEYIRRQYYIRDYVEFAGLNIYELELLLKFYNKRLQNLSDKIIKLKDKEQLNDLQIDINILVNEMLGIVSLKDSLIKETKKKVRK